MTKPQTFTIEQIKEAFWEEFHESGELWFPYDREDAEEVTNEFWNEFLEHLQDDPSPGH